MRNELLAIATLLISFSMLVFCNKKFGKGGVFAWIAFATILANIEVIKCIDIFGLSTAAGNVLYGSIFLGTDILNELYGAETAKKGVKIGFFSLIASTILMQLTLLFVPNSFDFASGALETIFSLSPRIAGASLIAYYISNRLDVWLYNYIGERTAKLWVKNNLATITSQFLDNVIFTGLAFVGVFDLKTIAEIFLTAYILKIIIALIDTPFLYLARHWHNKTK